MRCIITCFLFLSFNLGKCQNKPQATENYDEAISDSLFLENATDLGTIKLYSLRLRTKKEKLYYERLRHKLRGMYPYLRESVLLYNKINDSLENIHKKRYKKRYLKESQKELKKEFSSKLKGLTRWQGRLFIKLIHRETGKTLSQIIKQLKGGFNAFIFETKASLFDLDLGTKYNPDLIKEDRYVEVILSVGYRKGEFIPILPGDKPKYKLGKSKNKKE